MSINLKKETDKNNGKVTKFHRKENKALKSANKPLYQTFMSNTMTGMKVSTHNALIVGIYGMIMVLVVLVSVYLAGAGTALAMGFQGAITLATVAELIAFFTSMIMVCGFILFFAFKLENALIRAMRKRLWKRDKENNIIKGEYYEKVSIDTDKMPKAACVK